MTRHPVIMHVDMDAFYASVEMARRPELRDVPMYVGGAERGVVLSANYPARAFGIEGGMPSTRARRLCPQAVAVPPDHDTYADVSAGVMQLLRSLTDKVEVASIDEAFCDITGAIRRLGEPRTIGELLRARVADEQRIPCSVGIGPSKFIAKLASNQAKPDGLVEVPPDQITAFLHPLPVEAIWGGAATASRLHKLGLTTIDDLAHTPRPTLQRAFGTHQGHCCTTWPGDATTGPSRSPSRNTPSAPRPPSAATPMTPGWCTANCCGWRCGRRPGCGRRTCAAAQSASRCVSPTSPRSPGPANCPAPPTSPTRSTPRRCGSTRGCTCNAPESAGSVCGSRS